MPSDKEYIVSRLYPGLVYFQDGLVYLYDQTISSYPMEYSLRQDHSTMEYHVSFYGNGFMILMESKGSARGIFQMDDDLGLSIESCVELYRYNIDIYCGNGVDYPNPYDRVAIERRYAISNIINDK